MLRCGWAGFAAQRNKSVFLFGWRCAYENNADRDASIQLGHFCNTKGKSEHRITLAFVASRRACPPDGDLFYSTGGELHQTREPWHPSCHGSKIPAKPHVPLRPSRPMDVMWGQGALPLVRAMRPVAEWRSSIQLTRNPHQTGEPRGLSPSGGKPPGQAACPSMPLRAYAAQSGVKGYYPLVNGGNGGMLTGV